MGFDLREFVFHVLEEVQRPLESDPDSGQIHDILLTFGFMVLICSREGVPKTLMISTNWSIPDSPGNNG